MIRLFIAAFVVVALIFTGAFVFDPTRGQDAAAPIRTELQGATNSADLTARVEEALARNDYDEAVMYSEIAVFAGMPIAPNTEALLAREGTHVREIARGGGFVEGLTSEEAISSTALAGAVASDLTVIGDVRDISSEGARMLEGKDYDQLVLGLSVVGVGLTSATMASGGAALPAKVGISVLKVAKRAGVLSDNFTKYLVNIVSSAVNMPALRIALGDVPLSDAVVTRGAIETFARQVRTAKIFPTLAKIETMRSAAGAGEAVRLLEFVKTGEDLDNIVKLSRILGPKTRGVIEITGKSSVRLFKHSVNGVAIMLQNLSSLAAWLGSIITLFFSRRLFRLVGV